MILRLSLTCLLFLFTMLLSAQDMQYPVLSGYKKSSVISEYSGDNLKTYLKENTNAFLSSGFEKLSVTEYRKGRNVIKLEVYTHQNPNLAFGIYSSERSPSFRFINIGAQGYRNGNYLNFYKGKYYVKLRSASDNKKVISDMEFLALRVADMLPGEPVMPAALSLFPFNGKKLNAETYINENVLGHPFLKKAFRATYEADNITFNVYISESGTEADALKTVSEYLKVANLEPDEFSEGKFVFRDKSNGDIFLAWKGTRIVLIEGLSKGQSEIADFYTNSILN